MASWKILLGGLLKSLKSWGQVWRPESAQAIVELSIFGAIFLMVLAALISYGLKYNYIQRAEMQTFRTAMKIAADPDHGSASYMMIQDRHIPDPVESFGIGSVLPVVTSASVTRTNQMDSMAERASSLPSVVYDIQSVREDGVASTPNRLILLNSGWRQEFNIPEGTAEGSENSNRLFKYAMLYGTILGQKGGGWEPVNPTGEYDKSKYRPDRTCMPGHYICSDPDPDSGQSICDCDQYSINVIRIVDPCVGNMTDYTTCYEISRKIVDTDYCTMDCRRTCPFAKNPSKCHTDCANYCAAEMRPPNQKTRGRKSYDINLGGAWYADDWKYEKGAYVFPVLDKLFEKASSSVKALGMQTDIDTKTVRDTSFRRTENSESIETTEMATWSDETTRTFISHNNLVNGLEQTYSDPYRFTDHVDPVSYTSVNKGHVDQTWKTDK